MHIHEAQITWTRGEADFNRQRYSRGHEWSFDGGAKVLASASPSNVPAPYSLAERVDPEEALVAATSSCHMLWFLSLAAKRGFVVDSYVDRASGVIEKTAAGGHAFSRITLRPDIEFSGDKQPSESDLTTLHREAHENCFIANSLNCEVVVAGA